MHGLGKPFRKKMRSKKHRKKNRKNQSEIATCEQKTTSEKENFSLNTVFSLYFKIRAKKFHATKPPDCSLHFLFRRDQNHYSNLTSKMMKMCEQILKNIAGRTPETTVSEIILKVIQILIRQNVPVLIHAYFETNDKKSNNKKLKSVKIWLKIWSNFVKKWDPEKIISAKITLSKQLVPTKTTHENFF